MRISNFRKSTNKTFESIRESRISLIKDDIEVQKALLRLTEKMLQMNK